jgi:hypothetical protein
LLLQLRLGHRARGRRHRGGWRGRIGWASYGRWRW